jgi:hypothetical protein
VLERIVGNIAIGMAEGKGRETDTPVPSISANARQFQEQAHDGDFLAPPHNPPYRGNTCDPLSLHRRSLNYEHAKEKTQHFYMDRYYYYYSRDTSTWTVTIIITHATCD